MSDKQGKQKDAGTKQGVSTLKLALGAASLFLFIVGVKRSFKLEDVQADSAAADRSKTGRSR